MHLAYTCRSASLPPWGIQRFPRHPGDAWLYRAEVWNTILTPAQNWDVLCIQTPLHHESLVGIVPLGAVTFIYNLYGGSVSNKNIFKSGIAEKLTEGMVVMVDKGFLISNCCTCKVSYPPFLSKQKQMPAYQVRERQAIARLRVHVEHVIRRIKQTFWWCHRPITCLHQPTVCSNMYAVKLPEQDIC